MHTETFGYALRWDLDLHLWIGCINDCVAECTACYCTADTNYPATEELLAELGEQV